MLAHNNSTEQRPGQVAKFESLDTISALDESIPFPNSTHALVLSSPSWDFSKTLHVWLGILYWEALELLIFSHENFQTERASKTLKDYVTVSIFSLLSIQWHFEWWSPMKASWTIYILLRSGQGEPSTHVGSFLFLSEAS